VIRGRLVDERGVGLADHFVHVEDEGPWSEDPCRQAWAGRTDAEGRFSIEGPGDHAHRVEAHPMGETMVFPLAVATAVFPDRDEVRLEIAPEHRRSVWLEGSVVDESGAPVADASLRAKHAAHRRGASGLTDADGNFSLGPYPPGAFTLEVRAPAGRELASAKLGPEELAPDETWDCGTIVLAPR
jgi:hypothetical protein